MDSSPEAGSRKQRCRPAEDNRDARAIRSGHVAVAVEVAVSVVAIAAEKVNTMMAMAVAMVVAESVAATEPAPRRAEVVADVAGTAVSPAPPADPVERGATPFDVQISVVWAP
jgi:hypothetical protein